jgi:hypothetical protein
MEQVTGMGKMGNAYTILIEKPEGKMPIRRREHRWNYIIINQITVGGRGFMWLRTTSGGA